MMKGLQKFLFLGLLVSVLTVSWGLTQQAHALSLRVQDGAFDTTYGPEAGAVSTPGFVDSGNFMVNAAGLGPNLIGNFGFPSMDIGVTAASKSAGTLIVSLSQDNLIGNPPSSVTGFFLSPDNNSDIGVTVEYYIDQGNGLFAMTDLLGSFNLAAGNTDDMSTVPFIPTNPYSLTIIATFTATEKGQSISSDNALKAVPEPGTVLLMGTGLLGLGAWRMRKSKTA